jgi:Ca-activated chloride channel family protein
MEADISLIAMGLGSEEGGPVPVNQAGFEEEVPVISYLRSGTLRNAAEYTGGIYVDGNRSDAAAYLTDHIASLSSKSVPGGYRREGNPRWRLFVLAAIAALGISKAMEKGFGRNHAVS